MMDTRYENLKLYFPFIVEQAVQIEEEGLWYLVAHLDDGTSVIYDNYLKTIRRLPDNPRELTEEECRNEFGIRLRKVMQRKLISQKELAAKTGIDESLLSSYINGKRSPSFYKVDQIAKALDCSTEDFRYR